MVNVGWSPFSEHESHSTLHPLHSDFPIPALQSRVTAGCMHVFFLPFLFRFIAWPNTYNLEVPGLYNFISFSPCTQI